MKSFLILTLFISLPIFAKTEFSRTIEYVQKKYADKFERYPILIFDMDELEMRFADEKAFADDKEGETKRVEIIKAYVKEKTGIEISRNDAVNFETYTYALKEGAYALPIKTSRMTVKPKPIMCAVFPASPNSNQRLETERITGLNIEGAYQDVTFQGLKYKLTYKEMQLFSLYHELGHCMDEEFLPNNDSYSPSAHGTHESESFAEVFALFMLEREGIVGTAQTRAMFRNMYTQEMTKWFIANPQFGFGNPNFSQGGLIYYLSPSLLGAQKYINSNPKSLDHKTLKIIDLSKYIVHNYALDSRSFHAIARSFVEGVDETMEQYHQYSESSPDLFTKAYKDLLNFHEESPYLHSLIVGNTPNQNEGVALPLISHVDICSLDNEKFLLLLQENRDALKEFGISYESQKEKSLELNNLFKMKSDCN